MSPERHPSTTHVLKYFEHTHLAEDLAAVSAPFGELARATVERLPDSPELTVALRKLLESKDAAVRAALDAREG